jgi:hypothetical protein
MGNKRLAILSGIAIVASMLALTSVPAGAGRAGGVGYHGGEHDGLRGGESRGTRRGHGIARLPRHLRHRWPEYR